MALVHGVRDPSWSPCSSECTYVHTMTPAAVYLWERDRVAQN